MPSPRRRRGCSVLLLDPPDRQGHVAPQGLDAAHVTRLRGAVQEIWPGHDVLAQHWSATPDEPSRPGRSDAAKLHVSQAFTDVRRLADLPIGRFPRVVVLRPGALLLPAPVLQDLLDQAVARGLDLAVLGGIPSDICYVVSGRTLKLLTAVRDVPGAATLPQAVERLAAVAAGTVPLATTRVTSRDSDWLRLASAVAPATWRATPVGPWLDMPSADRLAAVIEAQQEAFMDAHAAVMRHRPRNLVVGDAANAGQVLVVVPSMFQTGAHAAWVELASALSPRQVAFVVGRGTALSGVLAHRGFPVHEVTEGLVPGSATDAAALLDALASVRPAVVHLDGAEGNAWAGMLHARGPRIVVHVRLNDVERFRPSFLYADAIVGVSDHLCDEIALRVGAAVRVEHIPDGVWLESGDETAPPAARPPFRAKGREALCLCVGRVEPAKNQLRVLDIFDALHAHLRCRLVIIGPCGSDAAYCDEVRRRIGAARRVEWRPFTFPLTDLYRQAHIVLVGSRNEALGMVGLETLAAGALLVAQRSTGYERIIDERQREGMLFERDESPEAVAGRIVAALGDFDTYSDNARRKVADRFDARACADRLSRLWRELSASLD